VLERNGLKEVSGLLEYPDAASNHQSGADGCRPAEN